MMLSKDSILRNKRKYTFEGRTLSLTPTVMRRMVTQNKGTAERGCTYFASEHANASPCIQLYTHKFIS